MKTHQVLDLHYHPEEGQGVFDGTLQECEEFAATQTPTFMYKVVPMTKEEIAAHPDNQSMNNISLKGVVALIFLFAMCFVSYSQNYIDYSRREIMNSFNERGDSYDTKYLKDGTPYLIIQDRVLSTVQMYYFDSSNKCCLYVICHFDTDYSLLIELLDKNYSRDGTYWYSSNSKINIKYSSEYGCYQVIFVRI